MYKNFVRIMLFACLIILTAANIFYYMQHKGFFADRQSPAQNSAAAGIKIKPAEKQPAAALSEQIHGQVIYDARSALTPQAVLDVKLTADDPAGQQSAVIIAETRQQLLGRSPLDWKLPVALSALDAQKSYSLQAKISGGDTLLFVNTAPLPVDRNRAAYIMRLEKLDNGSGDNADTGSFIGQNWLAEILLGKAVEASSEISLYIDTTARTDPAENVKRYPVSGSGGCNRYMGSAVIDETNKMLRFSPLTATFIACAPDIARQEADFIAAMDKVRGYKFDQTGAFYLLDEAQRPLARFTLH
ncbi:MAG: META domain-containing protein [Candidatus Tokpelaia sp.]|nr:MAG: META domain-containing protein [Candidatus Tokpelaia sp.]KAA6207636.1 MAG: META domain-containing protein [Candidatus Tokpelaia sp.]